MDRSPDDKAQNSKAVRLIEYLLRLASLRTNSVRDIENYERVLWLSDVPQQAGCYARVWGPNEDYDADIWVEVLNRREPELPHVPDECKGWIDPSALRNKQDLPTLAREKTTQTVNPAWHEGSDEPPFVQSTERIEDHAEVQKAWDRYVEERWMPWVDEHNRWECVHRVYASLFAIYQEQLRLGEEYELVLGLGLLTWRTPHAQRIRRHLIVADALLEFEARLGKFTVRPNLGGARVRPELDMLDIEQQPTRAEEIAKIALNSAADDPWETDCTEGVLRALVHSISPQGEYVHAVEAKSAGTADKPIVEYAPAIILRKRSRKGLTHTLVRIKARMENGEDAPIEFQNLAEISRRNEKGADRSEDSGRTDGSVNTEVFFPKPSNEEQRRIVDKIQATSGVLVQGPPGTGKSHTIANLICHLLATGQRILVTAKTPRALQVLMGRPTGTQKEKENQGLIPKEIRALCINLLGGGLDEQRSLESSVAGILARNEEWDEQRTIQELERYRTRLHLLREDKAKVDRRLRDIRESETHAHSVAEGTYCGTAARIAEGVARDRSAYEWFTDAVSLDHACPISGDYLQDLLTALRRFTTEKRRELSLTWPSAVASAQEISDLIQREKNASEQEAYSAKGADEQVADYLSKTDTATVKAIHESLSDVASRLRRLLGSSHAWTCDALRDTAGGNPSVWRELHRVTGDMVSSVGTLARVADATNITLPDGVNVATLLEDACALREHIRKGGTLGWGPFRPTVVKERTYVLKTIRINGRPCSGSEHLAALIDALRVRVECEKAWGFWAGRCERTPGPYALQIAALKAVHDTLGEILSLAGLIEKCRATLRRCPALGLPGWTDEPQIERLIASCELTLARNTKSVAVAEIEKTESPLEAVIAQGNPHPVVGALLQAIQQRDVEQFTLAEGKVKELEREQHALQKLDESLSGLRQLVPCLMEELVRTCTDSCWDVRVRQIESAWNWAQAKSWIQEYTRKEDAPALVKRAHQIEDEINATIARLAALRAWSFCFSRLTESHRQNMTAWQQAMRRLGKGTGKYAPQFRQEAQQHLNECREAVPAWVMPLHRIWDNVDPAPGMFDVIIVDEASQCGLEALPLFYLGKRVLVVGDDKQISPEEGFVDRNAVFQLIERFLFDFTFKDSFHCDASIFDHAKRLCGTRRIVLKEHFRCMPEIIRFSNDLCYHDTPLLPLRQYGRNRLTPLERRFVGNGYREGTGNRAVNRPEAVAIANKVRELCRDRKYAGKTMGVVVLQGDAQAGLIESQLLDLLGAEEMEHRRLICGNPYSFQGDERDIIFLSMVAAPNERIGPLAKSADERRFNVAASRARDQMWLFHSVRREDLSTSDLRRRLLDFFEHTEPQQIAGIERDELERRAAQDNRSIVRPPQPFESWFEVDVALELLRRGYVITPQYEVAGRRIDLVVEGGRARLAVECDGDEWHGADRYEDDMQRQRQLERCNWEFYHVRESAFYASKDSVLQALWHLLEERGIMPGGSPPPSSPEDKEDKTEPAHVDQDEADEDLEEESPPLNDVDAANGQLHRRSDEVTSSEIQDSILQCLENCPNRSCTLKSLPSRVLKELSVLTRGNPRLEFAKRVMRGVGALRRRGFVEEYKAKNRRIRLLVSGQGRTLFQ